MSLLRRFNTQGLSDAVVEALSTGREGVVTDILHMIDANVDMRPVQHAIVVAPRGFGKSFLMRLVQNRLRERTNITLALLPEEQRNVRRPHSLPEEIRRVFEQRPAADVRVRWSEEEPAWGRSVAALDDAIKARLGPEGLLVVAIENFDHLLATVFCDDEPQRRLRGWLTRESGRIMLLATATRSVDNDYARPLYQGLSPFLLPLWTEEHCLLFFDRVRERAGEPALTDREKARARAVAIFASGSPRIATVLYEVLSSGNAVTAATLLDGMADELSDYYRNQIDRLSPRAQDVVDTLLRAGEPKSQTDVAALLGESQSRVAEVFRELLADQFLRGTPSVHSRVTLYQVTDRLLVHFYRTRYFDPEHRMNPLEAVAEFLSAFFDADEKQTEMARLRAEGLHREANILASIPRLGSAGTVAQTSSGQDGQYFRRGRLADYDWYATHSGDAGRNPLIMCERLIDGMRDLADLASAEALLDSLDIETAFQTDAVCLALMLRWRGEVLGYRSAHPAAMATLREALTRAETAGDVREQSVTLRHIGWIEGQLGRHEEAIASLHEALARAEAAGDVREKAKTLRYIGWSQGQLGRHGEAIATLREALSRAEAAGNVREQAETLRHVGWSQGQLGRHKDAMATLREALSRSETAGNVREQAETLRHVGWSQGQLGRHKKSIATLHEALTRAETAGNVQGQAETLRHIGWSQGKLGRHGEAIATLQEALTRAEATDEVREQAETLRLIGWSQGQVGRHEEAIVTLRDAMTRAEAAGDVREQASGLARAMGHLALRARHTLHTLRDVPALMADMLSLTRNIGDGSNPADLFFDDVIALSIRSAEFPETWGAARAAADLLYGGVNLASEEAADEIQRLATTDGRAAGYAAAASVIKTLAAEATWPAGEGSTAAMMLREVVNALARSLTDGDLLGDITDLLDALLHDALATERALCRARVLDLQQPNDLAALESVDPDIAAAIRRLRGETDPEVLFRRNAGRTPATAGAATTKARIRSKKRRGDGS